MHSNNCYHCPYYHNVFNYLTELPQGYNKAVTSVCTLRYVLKKVAHLLRLEEIAAQMSTTLTICMWGGSNKENHVRKQKSMKGVPINIIISTVAVLRKVLASLTCLWSVGLERNSAAFKSGFL